MRDVRACRDMGRFLGDVAADVPLSVHTKAVSTREKGGYVFPKRNGTANGNRTRILALKGLRANRCTIAAWNEDNLLIIGETQANRYVRRNLGSRCATTLFGRPTLRARRFGWLRASLRWTLRDRRQIQEVQ